MNETAKEIDRQLKIGIKNNCEKLNYHHFQASCPVCREPISKDTEPLRDAAQPVEVQNAPDFELTAEMKTLQVRMASLYMHQMKRGGIIDSNGEESNVISIQSEDAREEVIAIVMYFFVCYR